MRRLYFIALFSLLSPLCALAQGPGSQEFIQKLQVAASYEARGDFQNAARLYEDLYHIQPDNPDILFSYVRVLTSLKQFTTADSILTAALARPNIQAFDLYLLLGKTRSMLGHKAEALDAFNKALEAGAEQNPYSLTTAVAQTMSDVGYTEEALALLKQRRNGDPYARYYTQLIGDLLFRMGKYREGTKEFLSLLQSNDKDASAGTFLAAIEGKISRFTADTASNRTIIRTVVAEIDPETKNIAELELLEWCYGELRNYDKGLDIALQIETLREHQDDGFALMQFADKALAEGAFDAASRAYSAAASRAERGTKPTTRSELYYDATLGVLRARLADLDARMPKNIEAIRGVVNELASLGMAQTTPNEIALEALDRAGDAAVAILHDPGMAKPYYEAIVKRSTGFSPTTRDAYFALESIALSLDQLDVARTLLDQLGTVLDRRRRTDDVEIRRHIQLEEARIYYFEGLFDTALATLEPIVAVAASEFANDAIALQSLISENRDASGDGALKVFAKADLLSLGRDLPSALAGYRSIMSMTPRPQIADEATLRAADLLVRTGTANEAISLLEDMQEKYTDSPILDQAAMREAEITEHELHSKDKALKLYEDFLAHYPKSPLCTEVRQRARRLRGDVF